MAEAEEAAVAPAAAPAVAAPAAAAPATADAPSSPSAPRAGVLRRVAGYAYWLLTEEADDGEGGGEGDDVPRLPFELSASRLAIALQLSRASLTLLASPPRPATSAAAAAAAVAADAAAVEAASPTALPAALPRRRPPCPTMQRPSPWRRAKGTGYRELLALPESPAACRLRRRHRHRQRQQRRRAAVSADGGGRAEREGLLLETHLADDGGALSMNRPLRAASRAVPPDVRDARGPLLRTRAHALGHAPRVDLSGPLRRASSCARYAATPAADD